MTRHPTSPLANLIIVAAATLLFVIDRLRIRRGKKLNEGDRCARCGGAIDEPGLRALIAGGPYAPWRGYVCTKCFVRAKLEERVLWSLAAAALVALLLLWWWSSPTT